MSMLVVDWGVVLAACVLGLTMTAIAVVDARTFIIPDILSLPAIPVGLAAAVFLNDRDVSLWISAEHLAAAAVGVATMLLVRQLYLVHRKRIGLGLGDVKLVAVAGSWTGLSGLGPVVLLAGVLAICGVVCTSVYQRRALHATMAVPFGAFLAPSIWAVWCAQRLGLKLGLFSLGV
jgi:leader peptidase (prepilin peptidase)/N-methyltransferase